MPPKLERLTFRFDDMDSDARLRELILYVAQKCDRDRRFGATKLNKILAFADFTSFFETRRPITGAEYMRLPQGPVPRRLKPVTEGMTAAHEMVLRVVPDGKYQQKRVIPLRDANLSLFTATEIALVDRAIDVFWGRTATAVSEFSHGIAWRIAKDRAPIPYESVFLSDEGITEYDIIRTRELADQYGWERV